jgi:hypothetical protein
VPKGDDPLVRLGRAFVRQRRRGYDPRPPLAGYEDTPFGRVTFGLSGGALPHPEISVSNKRVSVIKQGGLPREYEGKNVTKPVAAAVLAALTGDLIKRGEHTPSREKWLNDHPGALNTAGWSALDLETAALLYATTKYSEEQRTHGGKQMRAALRAIADGPTTGSHAFGEDAYLVPQADEVIDLRRVVNNWFRQQKKANPKGRAKTQKFGYVSDSSDDEADSPSRPKVSLKDDFAVMEAYRNGIAGPSDRDKTPLTLYFDPVRSAADEPEKDEELEAEPKPKASKARKSQGPATLTSSAMDLDRKPGPGSSASSTGQKRRKKAKVASRASKATYEERFGAPPPAQRPRKWRRLSGGRMGRTEPDEDLV